MIAPNRPAPPGGLSKTEGLAIARPLLPYFLSLQERIYRETGNPFEGCYKTLDRVEAIANLAFYYGVCQFIEDVFFVPLSAGTCRFSRSLNFPLIAVPHPTRTGASVGFKFNAVDDELLPRPRRSETGRAILAQQEIQIPLDSSWLAPDQELEDMNIVEWIHVGVRLRADSMGIPKLSLSYFDSDEVGRELVWSINDEEIEKIMTGIHQEAAEERKRPSLWKPTVVEKAERD